MHRIGGIEKEDGTGNISYDPENHERMVHLRAAKVAGIADDIPPVEVVGDVDDAELLVLGWGSTWGAIDAAVQPHPRRAAARSRRSTSRTSTRSRRTSARCCGATRQVLVPEMNLGQLSPAGARRVPGRRPVASRKVQGVPVHRRRARSTRSSRAEDAAMTDTDVPRHHARKDWSSDQEVRWCPGCGDYASSPRSSC